MKKKTVEFSPLIADNAPFIHRIHKAGRSFRALRKLISEASDTELLCFVEICLNTLRGRIPLKNRHLLRLKQQANLLRRLSRVRCAKSARSLLMPSHKPIQRGEGVPAIAGILASILVPMLAEKLINK